MPTKLDSDQYQQFDALKDFNVETYGKPESKLYTYTDHGEGFLDYLCNNKKDSERDYTADFERFRKEKAKEINQQLKECSFSFGKHEGETLGKVFKSDPEYCRWVAFELSGCARKEARYLEWFFFLLGTPAARDITQRSGKGKKRYGEIKRKRKSYHKKRRRSRSLSSDSETE